MMDLKRPVLVSIVSWNSAAEIDRCLRSVFSQTVPVEVFVFDNASRDETVARVARFPCAVTASPVNLGYSHGHNVNLRRELFDFALLLNPDVELREDFLAQLLPLFSDHPRTGMAGGKLLRMGDDGEVDMNNGRPILDSAGIYFTPALRHFDRGSQQQDRGQYERRERVFGITGAALLCRREMLEDVAFHGEFLDEDFFAYREDADLAWRAQLRGWKAVYEPAAVGLHRRRVLPLRRRRLSPSINCHSLKNRYLLRRKNMDWVVWLRCFPFMLARDLGILAYVLLFERSSLEAYRRLWQLRGRLREKRRQVQSSRRVSRWEVASWFSFLPVSKPLGGPEART